MHKKYDEKYLKIPFLAQTLMFSLIAYPTIVKHYYRQTMATCLVCLQIVEIHEKTKKKRKISTNT
jgi:hypothetical protein